MAKVDAGAKAAAAADAAAAGPTEAQQEMFQAQAILKASVRDLEGR